MLPTEFSVDEEELETILVEKDLVQCDVQVNTSKQDFQLSKGTGRSIVKEILLPECSHFCVEELRIVSGALKSSLIACLYL